MRPYLTVARKEIRDHLRDTRSLMSTAMYALMGPVVVMLVSFSRPVAEGGRPGLLLQMASVFALVAAFAGSMNVAMDAMAGERERRSLVPLLLNPVSRFDFVLGKWIAASLFGLGALALNLAGFLAALGLGAPGSLHALSGGVWLWVLAGLTPLVLLGSAIHLLVAAGSRTAKEAHSWLSMVVFAPMLVGMFLVFFPGWIGSWWFVAPVAGQQSLIARSIAGQPVLFVQGAVLAAVTVAASVPVLLGARRVLNRDDLLAG
jgi:sodium transport system permease protein